MKYYVSEFDFEIFEDTFSLCQEHIAFNIECTSTLHNLSHSVVYQNHEMKLIRNEILCNLIGI